MFKSIQLLKKSTTKNLCPLTSRIAPLHYALLVSLLALAITGDRCLSTFVEIVAWIWASQHLFTPKLSAVFIGSFRLIPFIIISCLCSLKWQSVKLSAVISATSKTNYYVNQKKVIKTYKQKNWYLVTVRSVRSLHVDDIIVSDPFATGSYPDNSEENREREEISVAQACL